MITVRGLRDLLSTLEPVNHLLLFGFRGFQFPKVDPGQELSKSPGMGTLLFVFLFIFAF